MNEKRRQHGRHTTVHIGKISRVYIQTGSAVFVGLLLLCLLLNALAWVVFRHLYGCLSCVACWRAYDVVTFCLFVFFPPCPFLATMPFGGFFLVRNFCLLSLLFFSEIVPGLIWFASVCFVTAAGLVAGQLMWDKQQTKLLQLYPLRLVATEPIHCSSIFITGIELRREEKINKSVDIEL